MIRPLTAYVCCKGAIALIDNSPVWMGDRQIGNIQICKVGLFYQISCKCSLPDDRIYKLYAQSAAGMQYLGIPVPEKGAYTVRTKISAGKLELRDIRFFVLPKDENAAQRLLRVRPDEPFEHLDCLESAVCVLQDGNVYLTVNGSHSAYDE